MDWLAVFEQEQVQFAILDRRADHELVGKMRCQSDWAVDFEDNESVIFVRNHREQF